MHDININTAKPPMVALIDESACIGCTQCIQACPVDAILGSAKLMHTVISAECTGCELCLPPCPVDCILMQPVAARPAPEQSRQRFQLRQQRLAREQRAARPQRTQTPLQPATLDEEAKKAFVAAAISRSKAKRAARTLKTMPIIEPETNIKTRR